MQRLNKNLASSAIGKITHALKSGEIRQLEAILELMPAEGNLKLGHIHSELYTQSTKPSANVAFNRLINRVNEVLEAQGSKVRMAITADKKVGDSRECWFETEPIQFPVPHTPQLDAIPEDQLEQSQYGQPLLNVDVVLMTFNQHELEQALKCFCPHARAVQLEGHNRVYYELGQHGVHNVVLVHSQQATIEAMKSAEVAIDVFQPKAVIAVGIAFGINSQKQKIGEVLISESIIPYELAKVNKDGSIKPRGSRPPAAKNLRDWFHQIDAHLNKEGSAEYAKRYFGSVFSGDKLIDNEHYRDELLKIDSEAIGGEMEGTGLFRACEGTKTDWIIVKAICDFADGNKGKNKEANQKIAAENAAKLVKAALEFGRIYTDKKQLTPPSNRAKPLTNNFQNHIAKCSDLRAIHEEALVKDARAQATSLKKELESSLDAEQVSGIPVVARLLEWASSSGAKSVFALLGEYGMGKTISCQLFDQQLRAQLQLNKKLPVPLYFDLRHVTSNTLKSGFHFKEVISDCIRFGWHSNEAQEIFSTGDIERWAVQSGVVMIFDGLDEVLVKLSESDGRIFTDQLYKYHAELKGKTTQPIKMLLTCRSQYFKTLDRQKDHFTGQERGGVSAEDIEAMVMLPLTEEQITNYLRHALPGIEPATIIDMVKSVHDLHDLSKRPFTLKLVGEFFPALEEARKAGKAISGVSLYRRVVDRWLNRDDGKHQIKSDHKSQLASHLAALLWKQKQSALPASEIEDWFMGWLADNPKIAFRYKDISADILEEDLRTATFLCREDDEKGSRFRFSHTSLQEFFLASYMLQAINDNKPDSWAIAKPSNETLVFLAQLLAEPEHKHLVNKLSEWRHQYYQHTSENLLHYALVAYGLGFSLPIISGIQLSGADLIALSVQGKPQSNFSLENANFSSANLSGAKFSNVELQGAKFSDALMDNAEFDKCLLNNSDWKKARIAGVRFFRCNMESANFSEAKIYRAHLLRCESLPAVLQSNPHCLVNKPLYDDNNIYYSTSGHTGGVNTCVITADGRYVISGSDDKSLRQWDMVTGECLREFVGHRKGVTSCVLTADGLYLISGSSDNSLRQWDLASGECVREFVGHSGRVTSCVLTSNGFYLISGSGDNSLRQWNMATGECVREFVGHGEEVSSCALTANDRYLISGSYDNSLRQWDMATGECTREFVGHSRAVTSCVLTADDCYLLSGAYDRSVRQWDIKTGGCVREFMGHREGVSSCALTADDRYVLSCSYDKSVRKWDMATSECVREFVGHSHWVTGCALSTDGRYLVSGSADESLRQWDMVSGECVHEFFGHSHWVSSCVLTEDGGYVISDSQDNNLRQWDISTGECIREFVGHSGWVTSCALTADGRYLVSGSWDKGLRQWDIATGECVREFVGHSMGVTSCALTADGCYLVSGSWDMSLRQWDMATGECVRVFVGHKGCVTSCLLTMDGRYLVSGAYDRSLRQWDMVSGECLREFVGQLSCALTADGRYLISGSYDKSLRQWDMVSGECVREFAGHSETITIYTLTADDRYLIAGSEDNNLQQWNMATGELVRKFVGSSGVVTSCALTTDGCYLVSGSSDSSLRVWELETGEQQKIFYSAPNRNYLSMTGDQQKILAKSEYAWRYFNGYYTNEKGEPHSFPVI